MKIQKAFIWTLFILAFLAGCSGNYGKLKNQSRADSKETQKKLIANWSDYTIWYQSAVIVFDPKDDDKTLLVSDSWGTVKDQKMSTEIVIANIIIQTPFFREEPGPGDVRPHVIAGPVPNRFFTGSFESVRCAITFSPLRPRVKLHVFRQDLQD